MKKFKDFIKKADLVTFALIALLGISTVFAWTQLTRTSSNRPTHPVVMVEDDLEDEQPVFSPIEPPVVAPVEPEVFLVPVDTTNYSVTTTFFDESSTDPTALASSLFFFELGGGKYSHPSQGMSFTCNNDQAVNVLAPLSGVISSVVDDHTVRGTIVTIDHDYGLQTVLTGVYDVTVAVGASVNRGDTLGVTGLSRMEPDAGNVVHMEVMRGGVFVNPEDVIGRSVQDL